MSESGSERRSLIENVRRWSRGVHRRVISHYHHLHRHPELSWQEEMTASYVEQTLRDLGYNPHRLLGTGVVVDLDGAAGLPRRALRADLDAISTHEATGLPHASENPGVMHACGHDAHTAILLGVAEILAEKTVSRTRPLRLIFQPAEESLPSGAQQLIDEGVLEGVADVISLHVWPGLESGTVGLRKGIVTAAADAFECRLSGPGGHGARPHETVDLIAVAARVIGVLIDLPWTHLDPLKQPTVITVGTIHGGESFNVIPDELRFGGTVRTLQPDAREKLPGLMETVVRNLAEPAGAQHEFVYRTGPPALRNDPDLTALAASVLSDIYGRQTIVTLQHPSMGSEDFSHYTEQRPGILLRLGSTARSAAAHPLHSSLFRVDEKALETGTAVMAAFALL